MFCLKVLIFDGSKMSANVARKNNRNTSACGKNSKMVDALEVVVVKREQILAYFYIWYINIGLGNIK